MSDVDVVDDPDELARLVGTPPDLRDRFEAACDAAGLAPRVAAAGLVAAGLVLIGGAWLLLRLVAADEPAVEASLPFAQPLDPATSTTAAPRQVIVHVAGAVLRPGVYELPATSRVVDAIEAAGGPDATADLARLNLAAEIDDGQQVYVVAFGEPAPAPESSAGEDAGPVDVNTADAARLETLPGIGPALAAAIIAHRDEHGPFVAVESLLDVPGIGEAKLAALRDLVTV